MASRQWQVGSGKWAIASGQWQVGNERWGVGSGKWAVVSGQWHPRKDCQIHLHNAVYLVFVFRVRVLLGVTVSIRDELCLGLWLGVWLESRIGFGINSWA